MLSTFRRMSTPDKIAAAILSLMVAAYCVFFSAYQIQRQNAFENSLDTLSIEQPLWNTLRGEFMRTTYYLQQSLNIQFGTEPRINLVELSLVYHSKFKATLCAEWVLSGPGVNISPRIRFFSSENVVNLARGDPFQPSPEVFSEPGVYRICNRRMGNGFLNNAYDLQISFYNGSTRFDPISIISSAKLGLI